METILLKAAELSLVLRVHLFGGMIAIPSHSLDRPVDVHEDKDSWFTLLLDMYILQSIKGLLTTKNNRALS